MLLKRLDFQNIGPLRIVLNCHRNYCVQKQDSGQDLEFSNNETVYCCDKSGLLEQHRNILKNKRPYKEPTSWIHLTEKYQRKIFGRYGMESGVNPRICFNTNADNVSQNRLDDLAEKQDILLMIRKYKTEKYQRNQEILQREEEISKKMVKLDQWKHELHARVAKKEAEALAAKEKKERLVEEVRRHFGYKVDPKDERFKEVLEQKEKEDKKKQKEAKRKAKEEKLISKLAGSLKAEQTN